MDTESLQIHLNSKFASSYNNSSSDCTFNLPNIEIPLGHHIMLSIQNATIPYSFYNIDDNNNLICLEFGAIQIDERTNQRNVIWSGANPYHMTNGNYNAYQLANHLAQILNLTVQYNSIINKFIFLLMQN